MAADPIFSDEHAAFRERVRAFAQQQLAPRSRGWDEREELPGEALELLADAGLLGILASKALGGEARDYVSLGIAIEEIAAADISCAEIAWIQNTIAHFFPGWGDETLRAVIRGKAVIALAMSEEQAGSDVSAMSTAARSDGDAYLVRGTKIHVSLTPGASVFAVSCLMPDEHERSRIGLLRIPADAAGVKVSQMKQMGARAHSLGTIELQDVRVPRTALMGDAHAGKALMYARFNVSRCMSPLTALGAAREVLRQTGEFAKRKLVFGRPIAANQGVSFPIVEHQAKVEASRLLAYKALWLNDQGLDASTEAAMAKLLGISAGIEAIKDCLPLWGANGYLRDFPIEQKLRDVLSLNFTGGTLNIMKVLLVRQLFGNEFSGIGK
jgi:cyclohexanecarboxyl-CoA dehydrogenase